jgi:DNA topoisomerase VI subunit A
MTEKRKMKSKESDQKVIEKIDNLAKRTIKEIKKSENPEVHIPLRSLSNAYFDEKDRVIKMGDKVQTRSFFNVGQAKKFMQTFLVAKTVKGLIAEGITTPIRSIYYNTKHVIGNTKEETWTDQSESDPIIEDLEVTLDSLREELHVRAGSKGAMVGNLTIVDTGDEINLRKMGSGGWAVPSIVEEDVVQFGKCEAEYILLIEKDTIWSRFNEDKFWKKNNCIILHGGGQPPRGVRRLLKRLHSELKLPVYVLVDNDVYGFYIYSVVKQGSINLAFESMRMAVPDARFIGLSSFDFEKYKLPASVVLKLKDVDKKRIKEVLNYPWFQKPHWQKELKYMLKTGVKLELEALSAKNFKFITEEYVPSKIKNKEYLD